MWLLEQCVRPIFHLPLSKCSQCLLSLPSRGGGVVLDFKVRLCQLPELEYWKPYWTVYFDILVEIFGEPRESNIEYTQFVL